MDAIGEANSNGSWRRCFDRLRKRRSTRSCCCSDSRVRLSVLPDLSTTVLKGVFTNGLKEDIRAKIRVLSTTTWANHAYGSKDWGPKCHFGSNEGAQKSHDEMKHGSRSTVEFPYTHASLLNTPQHYPIPTQPTQTLPSQPTETQPTQISLILIPKFDPHCNPVDSPKPVSPDRGKREGWATDDGRRNAERRVTRSRTRWHANWIGNPLRGRNKPVSHLQDCRESERPWGMHSDWQWCKPQFHFW